MSNLLKVRLSLKGRPLRTYTFDKPTVSIGRDPGADIFLDNTGVSREHALIDRTPGGYVLEDLGSANGTFLNEAVIAREVLGDDDVVRIGKFTLWVGLEGDRRDNLLAPGPLSPGTLGHTTVLSPEQMIKLTRKSKTEEDEAKRQSHLAPRRAAPQVTPTSFAMAVIAALVFGIFIGVAAALRFLG